MVGFSGVVDALAPGLLVVRRLVPVPTAPDPRLDERVGDDLAVAGRDVPPLPEAVADRVGLEPE